MPRRLIVLPCCLIVFERYAERLDAHAYAMPCRITKIRYVEVMMALMFTRRRAADYAARRHAIKDAAMPRHAAIVRRYAYADYADVNMSAAARAAAMSADMPLCRAAPPAPSIRYKMMIMPPPAMPRRPRHDVASCASCYDSGSAVAAATLTPPTMLIIAALFTYARRRVSLRHYA